MTLSAGRCFLRLRRAPVLRILLGLGVVWLASAGAMASATGDHRLRAMTLGGSQPAQAPVAVRVVLTTKTLSRALSVMPVIRFSRLPFPLPRTLGVDDRHQYQRMIGFGAAMTDSSAWLLHDFLSAGQRAQVMESVFGSRGIHLEITRVPMGGSDFTVGGRPYSYDDLPPGGTDPTMADFSIAHDARYILPTLRGVLAVNPGERLLATPWSPPPWMKANQAYDDVGSSGAVIGSDYGPLARYFVKFISAYQRSGIPIWAVTPQNEPAQNASYPNSSLPPAAESRFVTRYLAPALAAAGLGTRIYGGDSVSLGLYVQQLLQTSAAARHLFSGLAWHCYGGEQAMSTVHRIDPLVQQIVTECSPGIIPYAPAEAAISGLRNGAAAFLLWNLALDPAGGPVQPPNTGCPGCSALLTVSEAARRFDYTPAYYQLGQLSRFVMPGAVRIRTDRWVTEFGQASGAYGVTSGLDNVAFSNPDGTYVLVAYNNSSTASRFAVRWRGLGFDYTLAGGAMVTFRWRP